MRGGGQLLIQRLLFRGAVITLIFSLTFSACNTCAVACQVRPVRAAGAIVGHNRVSPAPAPALAPTVCRVRQRQCGAFRRSAGSLRAVRLIRFQAFKEHCKQQNLLMIAADAAVGRLKWKAKYGLNGQ